MRKATISSIRPNQYVVPHHPVARMRASRIRAELGVQSIKLLDELPIVHPHEFIPWIAELGAEEFHAQCTTLLEWHMALAWLTNPAAEWDHVETHT